MLTHRETLRKLRRYGVRRLRSAYDKDRLIFDYANLNDVNLQGALLRNVSMSHAQFRYARLNGTDFSQSYLPGCDFEYASLVGVNFSAASLFDTSFKHADLRGANFCGASLYGADFTRSITDSYTIGIFEAPSGDLIGWGKKDGHIIKMLIPKEARRSCATTRKHRAEYVKVLEIDGRTTAAPVFSYRLNYLGGKTKTVYEIGEITCADAWDPNRWAECSNGIHFFLTKREAEQWPE